MKIINNYFLILFHFDHRHSFNLSLHSIGSHCFSLEVSQSTVRCIFNHFHRRISKKTSAFFSILFNVYSIIWPVLPHRWFFFSLSLPSPPLLPPQHRSRLSRRFFFLFLLLLLLYHYSVLRSYSPSFLPNARRKIFFLLRRRLLFASSTRFVMTVVLLVYGSKWKRTFLHRVFFF